MLLASLLSSMACLSLLLPSSYLLLLPSSSTSLLSSSKAWVTSHRLDSAVHAHLVTALHWLYSHRLPLLAGLIAASLLHLLHSLLLLLGALLHSRSLLLPWLVSQALVLTAMALAFTACTFLSLFVSLPMAVVCPVLAGLVLGAWGHLWRRVARAYSRLGEARQVRVVARGEARVVAREEARVEARGVHRPHTHHLLRGEAREGPSVLCKSAR